MTPEQFDRWEDFATRMARIHFAAHRRPSAEWILSEVEQVLADLKPQCEDITDWDGNEGGPVIVGDIVCEFMEGACPEVYFRDARIRDEAILIREMEGDDGRFDREGRDLISDYIREIYSDREHDATMRREDQWYGPVRCCLRAGLDLASAPSAGVVGFTAGDLFNMYPDGLPEWLGLLGFGPDAGPLRPLRDIPAEQGVWL
jgi:hypothetical protein